MRWRGGNKKKILITLPSRIIRNKKGPEQDI